MAAGLMHSRTKPAPSSMSLRDKNAKIGVTVSTAGSAAMALSASRNFSGSPVASEVMSVGFDTLP